MTYALNRLSALFATAATAAIAASLTACGGGGSDSSPTSPPTTAPAPSPTPAAPPPALTPAPAPAAVPVALLPAGTQPALTAADCAALTAASSPAPSPLIDADAVEANRVLLAAGAAHGYAEFARVTPDFTWWMRSSGASAVDLDSLGTAAHEVNHNIDALLSYTCNRDGAARYFVAGTVYKTDLTSGSTANYSIVAETYPAALKTSRAGRYNLYVAGAAAAAASGNTFGVLLDELNAYTGGSELEAAILAQPSLAYLGRSGDFNAGGMADFMAFMQFYLQAARLNHGQAYANIQGSAATVAYMQVAWTRAEAALATMYPYSAKAGGGQVVPVDVLATVYSADALHELDALGITHKTAADFASTYLR